MKYAKADYNTPAIIQAVHACGWQWIDTHQLGAGFGDGIAVHRNEDGTWRKIMVEIKEPGGKLTPAERRFHEIFPGLIKIWRTDEDVIRDIRGGQS